MEPTAAAKPSRGVIAGRMWGLSLDGHKRVRGRHRRGEVIGTQE